MGCPSTFRQQVAADVKDVFMSLDDFAETLDVDGQPVKAVIETDTDTTSTTPAALGFSEGRAVLRFKAGKVKPVPAGAALIVNGRNLTVESWATEMGVDVVAVTGWGAW